jgi:FtsP/CotA-like multicopper oxidase with cupredoxin domain
MVSAGQAVDDRLPAGVKLAESEDLAQEEVDEHHRIVFSEAPFGSSTATKFLVNGKLFDPHRVDQRMKLGEVNEWTVENATTEWHSFHIHVNNFQVTGLEGQAPTDVSNANARDIGVGSYQDTVVLPPGKTVTFRTKPTNFTGKFVFHCHMTNHEDRGMMAVTEITK